MTRHRWVVPLVLVVITLLTGTQLSAQSAGEPIRIGVLVPLTGAFAGLGEDAMEGTKLAFDEVDYTVAGRPVQLFFEDTAASPTLTVQKTQRLVQRERVDLILGPLSGSEAVAIKDYAPRIPDVTIIVAGAASEDVTMRGVPPNVFRTAYSGAQVMFPLGDYVYNELGYRKVVTLGEDYAFPHTQVGGFIASFMLAGGEVPERFWVPIGTADFGSIISEIPADVDALMVTLGGTDAVTFLQQAQAFGLLDRVTILGGSVTVDATVLESSGELLEGVLSGSHYAQVLPYPEFEEFDRAFVDRVGRASSLFAADYYIAAKVAMSALEAVGGRIEEQDAYREALLEVKMDTPRGPFRFDDWHNVVLTAYINEVVKVDGEYRNVPIAHFPETTQFGPFDPTWYEAQPPFDRVNPTEETIGNAQLAQQ